MGDFFILNNAIKCHVNVRSLIYFGFARALEVTYNLMVDPSASTFGFQVVNLEYMREWVIKYLHWMRIFGT